MGRGFRSGRRPAVALAVLLAAAACGDGEATTAAAPAEPEPPAAPALGGAATDRTDSAGDAGEEVGAGGDGSAGDPPAAAGSPPAAGAETAEPEAAAPAGEGAAETPAPAPVPGDAASGAGTETPANVYADPRGGVFAEFQRGFDRDHPFGSLDAFCLPHGEAAEPRRATDAGIGAEAVTFAHLRTRIEEIIDLGFAAPVGDPTDMFDTFTRIVNERCGGVWGRRVDMRLVEAPALGFGGTDIDTLRNAACIEVTEDHEAVVALNTTSFQGSALLCIAEEHDAAFIGNQALPEEYVRRGEGRMLTMATTLEGNLRALAGYLVAAGALEGRRVGVVAPNTPGEAEATEAALVATLEGAGVDVAVFDVLDCAGTSVCVGGMAESVQRMIEERVDVLFPTLNAISLPSYVTEMLAQGFGPGDVQFYNSDFNSHGNEVVAGLVVTFGGDPAGALYDGAVLLVHADAGRFREPDHREAAFDEMCMREYRENSPTGEDYDPRDPAETGKYGMVGLVCTMYRVALRALYDAGPNPTRADVFAALENLGPVDVPGMLPSSLAPGKWAMGDSLLPVTFRYPCPFEGLGSGPGVCLVPGDYSRMQVGID